MTKRRANAQRNNETSPFWVENDPRLRALAAGGATTSEAAAILGVSKNAVIGRAHRLNLTWLGSPTWRHRTMEDRLSVLEEKFNAVIAATASSPSHYMKPEKEIQP